MARPANDERVLLQTRVPASIHRRLKIESAKRDRTIQDIVADVLDATLPVDPTDDDRSAA